MGSSPLFFFSFFAPRKIPRPSTDMGNSHVLKLGVYLAVWNSSVEGSRAKRAKSSSVSELLDHHCAGLMSVPLPAAICLVN